MPAIPSITSQASSGADAQGGNAGGGATFGAFTVNQSKGLPWWAVVAIAITSAGVAFWFLFRRRSKK